MDDVIDRVICCKLSYSLISMVGELKEKTNQ